MDDGDGSTTRWMYSVPQNCTLKMAKMAISMLCMFYHNRKELILASIHLAQGFSSQPLSYPWFEILILGKSPLINLSFSKGLSLCSLCQMWVACSQWVLKRHIRRPAICLSRKAMRWESVPDEPSFPAVITKALDTWRKPSWTLLVRPLPSE